MLTVTPQTGTIHILSTIIYKLSIWFFPWGGEEGVKIHRKIITYVTRKESIKNLNIPVTRHNIQLSISGLKK